MNRREFLKGALAALAVVILPKGKQTKTDQTADNLDAFCEEVAQADPALTFDVVPEPQKRGELWDALHEIGDVIRRNSEACAGTQPEWWVTMHPDDWEELRYACTNSNLTPPLDPPEYEPKDAGAWRLYTDRGVYTCDDIEADRPEWVCGIDAASPDDDYTGVTLGCTDGDGVWHTMETVSVPGKFDPYEVIVNTGHIDAPIAGASWQFPPTTQECLDRLKMRIERGPDA
jgi:hypothetical protein